MTVATSQWVCTRELLRILGIGRTTLMELKKRDILKVDRHYRKANPMSARGVLLWHVARTLAALHAD